MRRIVLAAMILGGTLAVAPLPVMAAEEGLEVAAVATYRLEESAVSVSVVLTLENTLPTREEGGVTFQYFFDHIVIPIPASAVAIGATNEGGRRLALETTEGTGVLQVDVALAGPLLFGETTEVRLEFDLEGAEARSEGPIRVNPAYAWFFAWAYGDPGRSEVAIELPSAYTFEWLGGPVVETEGDGVVRLVAPAIADPDQWFVAVSARRDASLDSGSVSFSGGTLNIRSWPADTEWATFVSDTARRALPRLIEAVGLDWPKNSIEILEAYTPTIYGYAGWYLPDRGRIEIGEDLDAHVILHEASHVWFNQTLFQERWINEGMAEEYAFRARTAVGLPGPDVPDSLDETAPFSLNRWEVPTFLRDDSFEDELYGYGASWFVTHLLVEDIGLEAMQEVIAAADADLISYRGAGQAEIVDARDDWRRYLDLLEEIGGSQKAEQIFRDLVTTRIEEEALDRRARARAGYRELELIAGEWALPTVLRMAMNEWDFGLAESLIPQLSVMLENRNKLVETAARLDLNPPDLERMFETATDLRLVAGELHDQLAAIGTVEQSALAIARPRNLFESVGMWGDSVEEEFEQAQLAFEANDLVGAVQYSGLISQTLSGAEVVGERRLAVGVGIMLTLAAGVWLVALGRRRPQGTSITQTSSSPND